MDAKRKQNLFIIILSLARFQNRVPTYSLVQWESQNSVVLLKKALIGCIDFIWKIVRLDVSNALS